MPPLFTPSRALLRLRPAHHLRVTAVSTTQCLAQQQRAKASAVEEHSGEYDRTPAFDSPFKSKDENPTTNIPSFKNYMSKRGETSNKTFQYFMVGSMGLLAAAGAKATVQGESVMLSYRGTCGVNVGLEFHSRECETGPGGSHSTSTTS